MVGKNHWAYKAVKSKDIRLCSICLKNKKRCGDSVRQYTVKSWKNYRKSQWNEK